ncbi:MAG: HD domain-containing protein [Nitrospirae bacterium]|nr:HD domain-containing protein [Nitrospirota bacterium]
MLTKNKRVNVKTSVDLHAAVDLDKLCEGKHLPFDVFVKDMGIIKPLFEKMTLFTNTSKDALKEKGITKVFVRESDIDDNEAYFAATKTETSSFYDNPAIFAKYAFYKDQHHQIDRTLLVPGAKINFGLYLMIKLDFSPLLEATVENPAQIHKGIFTISGDIVIKKSDIPLYLQYLNSFTISQRIPAEERLRTRMTVIKEKAKIILRDFLDGPAALAGVMGKGTKEKAKILVCEILNNPKCGESMRELEGPVNGMIDGIMENGSAIYGLLSLKGHDYYTYTHSVNVAALAINLGIALDLKRDHLEKLGMGAILHDIGESVISPRIVHRQGSLSEAEYRVFRNHVIEGEKILCNYKEFPGESFPAVVQHHEKLSGKGYPHQLSGKQITIFGRITAIADCFDALTTSRPFKPAVPPYKALSVLAGETANYDHEFLRVFIKTLMKLQ